MIAVGVDTHKRWHVAVALSPLGELLGEIAVAVSAAGYRELVSWLAGLDGEVMVGDRGRRQLRRRLVPALAGRRDQRGGG